MWTFLSGIWSDAPGRALHELDRVLLYLLVLLLVASVPRTSRTVRWAVRVLALAAFVVALSALVTRVLPDLWPTAPGVASDRLSYPLTYWNALGAMSAIGLLLAFALTSDAREHVAVRVAGAGALPVFAATLLLTLSRASIGLAVVCLVALVAAARSRETLAGVLVLPPAILALVAVYEADLLSSAHPTAPAAVSQGRGVAVTVVACALAAAALRWLLAARLERRLASVRLPRFAGPGRTATMAVAAVGAVLAAGLAAGGADALSRQYTRFLEGDEVTASGGDLRRRLVSAGNNGRIEQWRVAQRSFAEHRLLGTGAGTYGLQWQLRREDRYEVQDAHSLYLEAAGELGVVGLLLIAAMVLVVVVTSFLRAVRGGGDRVPLAGLFAAGLLWAVHAGIDWDWELPALTLLFFAAAGATLSARAESGLRLRLGAPSRVASAGAIGVILLTPVLIAVSEHASRDSKRAFARGDCETALKRATDAIDTLSVTPEPFEILGYCALRRGDVTTGVASMAAAVQRDPHNWRPHYGLALALAASERDPRPAIRRARELNPLESLAWTASKSFWETTDPRSWKRRAELSALPTD